MRNNKGFTVIELVISFAFVSALTASLFTLVLNYKEKAQDAADIVAITNFKNIVSTVIQRDIETKMLKKIEYCRNGTAIINRCVNFVFQDGTSKRLRIAYSEETAEVVSSTLSYYKYYIIYDDILYQVPAEGNIEVRADYMLNYTTQDDSIENKLGIYRVNLTFYHKSLDVDARLNIVGVGEGYNKPEGGGTYVSYSVGKAVTVVLNSGCNAEGVCNQEKKEDYFHVIQDSDKYDSKVTVLADKTYSSSLMFQTSAINPVNTFEDSIVNESLNTLYRDWTTLEQRSDIRLITANEVSLLAGVGIGTTVYDAPTTISMGSLNQTQNSFFTLATGNDFWTSTNYLTTGTQDSMWVYKDKKLIKAKMDTSHGIRPVIRVNKNYILERVDS